MVSFFQKLVWILLYPFFHVFLSLSIKDAALIPSRGPYIIASNHVSFVDPYLLCALRWRYMRRVFGIRFLMAEYYYNNLFIQLLTRPVGALKAPALAWSYESYFNESIRHLEQSEPLLLFIEGRRALGVPIKPKPGIGYLASTTNIVVVPLKIERFNWRSFRLTFGAPRKHTSIDYQETAHRIYRSISKL